ncbi:MAG: DUF433 domain-containing protein [Holophagales bacterium]|nr:DUF433 domain-containing protein [Holophagales bacterium]MYF96393.1 DUF433 domain-containing protein [Holophagales bacterium]
MEAPEDDERLSEEGERLLNEGYEDLDAGRTHTLEEVKRDVANAELLARITARADVFGGKPIIRDMRISVELILSLLAQGVTEEAILADYPELETDDVRACTADAHAVVARDTLSAVSVAEECDAGGCCRGEALRSAETALGICCSRRGWNSPSATRPATARPLLKERERLTNGPTSRAADGSAWWRRRTPGRVVLRQWGRRSRQ